MTGTAADLYGSWSATMSEPARVGGGPATGAPSPAGEGVRTIPAASAAGVFGQPLFWLIVLLGVAIGLISFSLRVGK